MTKPMRIAFTLFLLLSACKAEPPKKQVVIPPSAVTPSRLVGTLLDPDSVPFQGMAGSAIVTRSHGFAFVENGEMHAVLFDSLAHRRGTVGRKGSGPGEFQFLRALFAFPGDTLAVFDPVQQRVLYFKDSVYTGAMDRFEKWQLSPESEVRLVGRFADGRWVGMRSAARTFELGARLVVDTPVFVAGKADEAPRELLRLTPVRYVDVAQSNRSMRQSLAQEVSPGVARVCDSGLVVVDTTGVHYFDAHGRLTEKFALPTGRRPLSAADRAQGIERSLWGLEAGPIRDRAQKMLTSIMDDAKFEQMPTVLDSEGHIWMMTGTSRDNRAFARFDRAGAPDGAVQLPQWTSPSVMGSRNFAGMNLNRETHEMTYTLYTLPAPKSSAGPNLGWCSAAVQY